eukprot:TRINITY_DN3795_c0_g2_i1.p1 TRINITY_DN3795_c0_g2~~TRINITY_DN3795_c0_g2_i1.p1  ORF type:complete len:418 (+),score=35.53 TRINITY_DN3795_c0_g2_i1:26-1279(+)
MQRPKSSKNTSLVSLSANLANSTIGAGVLSLSFAFMTTGYITGLIFAIIFGLVSLYTLHLLIDAKDYLEEKQGNAISVEYEDLGYEVLGVPGYVFISFACIISNFGGCIGYLIIVADLLDPIFQSLGLTFNRMLVSSVVTVTCILPLSMVRNFDPLKFTSFISISGILMFVSLVVVYAFSNISAEVISTLEPINLTSSVFLVTPLFTFSYACHTNMLPAYKELPDHLRPKVLRSTASAVLLSFTVYAVSGEMGYLTFGVHTQENLINSYPFLLIINIMRLLFSITIIFTYPVAFFPLKHSMNMLILLFQGKLNSDKFRSTTISPLKNIIITPLIVTISLVFAVTFPSIVRVFSLVGATATTSVSYIFPALITVKINGISSKKSWISILLIVAGVLFGATSTFLNISDIIENGIIPHW